LYPPVAVPPEATTLTSPLLFPQVEPINEPVNVKSEGLTNAIESFNEQPLLSTTE